MQPDFAATRAMQDRFRRQGRSTWSRLLDALLALSGGHAQLVSHAERPWASATFSGSRHQVTLCFERYETFDAAEHFIEALPEHEFAIPGQLVADAGVVEAQMIMLPVAKFTVSVELLLLEDA